MTIPLSRQSTCAALAVLVASCFSIAQAQTNWTGSTSTDWNNAANWSAGVPSGNTVIDLNSGNQPLLSGAAGNTSNLTIGNTSASGANTILTISSSGVLTSSGTFRVGNNTNSNGTVIVTGVGSAWNAFAGALVVGVSGTGNLAVLSGGNVATGFTILGQQTTGTGFTAVDGAGAVLTASQALTIGSAGNGTLLISNGGNVVYGSASSTTVGSGPSSHGCLTITGAGSKISGPTTLLIANSGTGNLVISNGGNASVPNFFMAATTAGHANATIDGAGSLLQSGNVVVVGSGGNATLNVTNGGDVSTVHTVIASAATAQGTINIAGVGSTWNNTGNFIIGNLGTGLLALADGAKLITSNLTITNNGTLSLGIGGTTGGLHYGEIDVSNTLALGGTLTVLFTGGFVPIGGESFHLLELGLGSIVSGDFTTYNLPSLGPHLSWNTSSLFSSGDLMVVAVPEPAETGLALMAGVLAIVSLRRHRPVARK